MQTRAPLDPAHTSKLGTAVHICAYYEWALINLIERYRRGFAARYSRKAVIPSGAVLQILRGIASDPATPLVETQFLRRSCETLAEMMDLRDALIHAQPVTAADGHRMLPALPDKATPELQSLPEGLEVALAKIDQAAFDVINFTFGLRAKPPEIDQSTDADVPAANSIFPASNPAPPMRSGYPPEEPAVFELQTASDVKRLTGFLLTHWSLPRIKISTDAFPRSIGSMAQTRLVRLGEANDSLTGALLAAALTLQVGLAFMLWYVSRSWMELVAMALAMAVAGIIGRFFTVVVTRVRILRTLSNLRRQLRSGA